MPRCPRELRELRDFTLPPAWRGLRASVAHRRLEGFHPEGEKKLAGRLEEQGEP